MVFLLLSLLIYKPAHAQTTGPAYFYHVDFAPHSMTSEEFTKFCQDHGVKKAGHWESGAPLDGTPYYHILVPRQELSNFWLELIRHGEVSLLRTYIMRAKPPGAQGQIPAGYVRFALWFGRDLNKGRLPIRQTVRDPSFVPHVTLGDMTGRDATNF